MSKKDYLEKLKAQRAKIEARIQGAEAREKVKTRKQDTRRKILIGAYYLDQARENNTMDEIKKLMDKYLSRDSDRKLFDLNPKGTK
jgi:large subunit ribosomal protein L7/L12